MEKYFYKAFENMERLGPGSKQSTLQAVACIDREQPVKILDVGCGVGTHTFLLASEIVNAEIIAIDNNQDYINTLNENAKSLAINDRVQGVCMSMFDMIFDDASFDYIFAEGAIYIAGFTNGLSEWKRLLKKGGMLICSEISWIVDTPSEAPVAFWASNYSQMDSVANKISQAERLGYDVVCHFVLPKEAWTDNYYTPLQKNLDMMKRNYADNNDALDVVNIIQEEIDLYHKFGDEYSYVFYILQRK